MHKIVLTPSPSPTTRPVPAIIGGTGHYVGEIVSDQDHCFDWVNTFVRRRTSLHATYRRRMDVSTFSGHTFVTSLRQAVTRRSSSANEAFGRRTDARHARAVVRNKCETAQRRANIEEQMSITVAWSHGTNVVQLSVAPSAANRCTRSAGTRTLMLSPT